MVISTTAAPIPSPKLLALDWGTSSLRAYLMYVRCPANSQTLAAHSVRVPSGLGPDVLIAPGVLFDQADQLPDVMRGEEIQIAGALLQNPQWTARSCIVLPGTHSKWVQIENGGIVSFSTYLTGELFAVLKKHWRCRAMPTLCLVVGLSGPTGLHCAR